MPEFTEPTPFWLDVAAVLALGGAMVLLFGFAWRHAPQPTPAAEPIWTVDRG
jgi:hypothetical protein